MIRPDQIPDEVVEALGAALGNTRPTWDYAEAIAAALNAWQGVDRYLGAVVLPLPQEKHND
jgi:hypothetical protein